MFNAACKHVSIPDFISEIISLKRTSVCTRASSFQTLNRSPDTATAKNNDTTTKPFDAHTHTTVKDGENRTDRYLTTLKIQEGEGDKGEERGEENKEEEEEVNDCDGRRKTPEKKRRLKRQGKRKNRWLNEEL